MDPDFPEYTEEQRKMWLDLTEQLSNYGRISHDFMVTIVRPQPGCYWWTPDRDVRDLIFHGNSFSFAWEDKHLPRVKTFLNAMKTGLIHEEVDSDD